MKPKKETGFLSCEQGLLSLEASIVVTIFIFLVLFLQSFFVIFEARNEMAHVTLATCNSLALDVYENEQLTHSSATMDFFLALNGIGRTLHSDSFVDDSLCHKVAKGSGPAGIWNGTIYATEAGKTDAEAKAKAEADKNGTPNTKTNDVFGNSAVAVSADLENAIRKRFVAYLSGGNTAQAERILKRYKIVGGVDHLDFSGSYISSGKLYVSVKYEIEYTFNTFKVPGQKPLRFEHTACSKLWS